MERYLLGVDVGTTGTKTALFSETGGMISLDYESYALSTPAVGYSEQSAEDLWNAVVKTIRTVCQGRVEPEQVAAISLSLQGGTLIPVDQDFEPLRPAIVWSDTRCAREAKEFAEVFGVDYMYQKTGWELENSLVAMQLLWLRRNEPELFEKAAMFLSVPDFIAAKLTGIPALDLSDAGINQLADIHTGTYDKAILEYIGIKEEQLGKIVPSGHVIGNLTAQAAKLLGLTEKTVLVSGAHDQYAVAAGAGCIKSGDILIGTGTAWVVTALSEEWDFENGFSQSAAAFHDLKGSLVSLSTGGVCLEWLRRNVAKGAGEEEMVSYDVLNEKAAQKEIGTGGLMFYPYFSGASYPVADSASKASFIGLDMSHDRFDMVRAVMEGVAFQIVWSLEGFREKFPASAIKLAGGATKSPLWCQIIADVADLPVRIPEIADLACVGAALLAGVGCGVYASAEEGYRSLAVRETEILPDPLSVERYAKAFGSYKKGAAQLGALYEDLRKQDCGDEKR